MLDVFEVTQTIAISTATSDVLDCSLGQLVGLIFPAALTGTAMTFTMSNAKEGTYVPVQATGGASAYSITVAASKYVPVDLNTFSGIRYLKLVSGSTELAARSIIAVFRPVR